MDVKYLYSLRSIEIENNNLDYELEGFILTTSSQIRKKEFGTEHEFISQIGRAFLAGFDNLPYLYRRTKEKNQIATHEDILKSSETFIWNLHRFMGFLWFIKDNSCNLNTLFTYNLENKHLHYRNINRDFSTCQGQFIRTTFTLDELDSVKEIINQYAAINKAELDNEHASIKYDLHSTQERLTNYVKYNSTTRIDRAIGFLNIARSTSLLPMKIAFYIPVLEALFSTGYEQLSEQISDSVSNYIGGTSSEKDANYKLLKHVYKFRSSYFHGSRFAKYKDILSQRELALKIDDITRKVLTKVIMIDYDRFIFDKNDKPKFIEWITKFFK